MSLEVWGDEGDVPSCARDTAIWQELATLQSQLYRWYERNKSDFPNDEFEDAFKRCDQALQDMFGELEDGIRPIEEEL